MEREKALRKLASGAAMVEISGKRPYALLHFLRVGQLLLPHVALPLPCYSSKLASREAVYRAIKFLYRLWYH